MNISKYDFIYELQISTQQYNYRFGILSGNSRTTELGFTYNFLI